MESVNSQRRRVLNLLDAKYRRSKSTDDVLETHLELLLRDGAFTECPILQHTPLASPSHIRLLTVFPGHHHLELRCSIQQVNLTNLNTDFVALSYTWGDADYLLPIHCDGAIELVGVNLYSAMLRARRAAKNLLIWIDAICIDQGTDSAALQERASQVRIMDKIYSAAEFVLVDLGGCNTSNMTRLLAIFKDFDSVPSQDYQRASDNRKVVGKLNQYMSDISFWVSLSNFARRPWFRRIWVVQEFALAREVTMQVGEFLVSPLHIFFVMGRIMDTKASHFNAMGTRSSEVSRLSLFVTPVLESLGHMLSMRDQSLSRNTSQLFGMQKSPDLPKLLDYARTLKAKNVRDHVYALMGIIIDLNLANFAIDYTESGAAVALRFAYTMVEQGFGAYCLSRASGVNRDMPSWVPPLCLRNTFEATSLFAGLGMATSILNNEAVYKACGNTQLSLHTTTDVNTLTVQAIQIDTIKAFSMPSAGYELDDNFHWLRKEKYASPDVSYHYLETWALENFKEREGTLFWNSFWRTIILDYTSASVWADREIRAPSTIGKDFESFRQVYQNQTHNQAEARLPSLTQAQKEQYFSAQRFFKMFASNSAGKRLCRTQRQRMAMIPSKSTHDNEIWIILGFPVPFVLRRMEGYYLIVGQCYVHGMMDGQAMTSPDRKVETIYLR